MIREIHYFKTENVIFDQSSSYQVILNFLSKMVASFDLA